jgi:arsenate reductase
MDIKIFHNSRCGTSRTTLETIRDAGHRAPVVDYLAQPPTREQLKDLIARAGLSVRDAVRSKEALFTGTRAGRPGHDRRRPAGRDGRHPILINRPFVVTAKGVRLCRPSELVHDIL